MSGPHTIAIDGPVASGKTAVGRLVAERLGLRFIDTGVVYRAVTSEAVRRGVRLEDEGALTELSQALTLELVSVDGEERLLVDGVDITDRLRDPEIEHGVSLVAKVPGVRRALVEQQRAITRKGGFVVAGRDIGTVVLPDAPVKVYLDASIGVRARRRHEELKGQGASVDYAQVESALKRRDKIDSERVDSPLRPAKDAVLIDTDDLDVVELVERILGLVDHS